MKTQLVVKYKSAKNLERRLKMQSHESAMIGTARKAHLRVVGDDIAAYHAGVEFRNGEWFVFDMASDSGTWVDKENIVEKKIEEELDVRIGDHDFNFKVIPAPQTLFNFEERRNVSPDIHEVVIKSFGQIVETHYLHKDQPFVYNNGFGGNTILKAPRDTAWVHTEVSGFQIQQRLRSKPKPLEVPPQKTFSENRTHQVITAVGLLMIMLGIYFFPKQPKMDLPSDQNKYARIIYDAKLVKEKKKQSASREQKMQNNETQGAKGQATAGKAFEQALAKSGASQKTVKAISQIHASGLKNLLGRIAVRASMNADMIQVHGEAGGKAASANVFAGTEVSSAGFGNTKTASQSVGAGGVGTNGKGGGGTGYKGLGKLSQGEIGHAATVGMLDDEAEVSGGIDKDAIAEVIRSNIGQIRFCYERRLSAIPNLYGKVLVQFSIQDGGTVLLPKVNQSTLSDSVVEGCILRRIASWKFPSPPAGTSVVVTYPFLFKSTQ